MRITVADPITQTVIVVVVLIATVLLTLRRRNTAQLLGLTTSLELKGLAMLAMTFSHMGYFLSLDSTFLYPLSTIGGVGVNIFLFLSGYGLAVVAWKKQQTLKQFYRRRLSRLYIPYWVVLIIFLLLALVAYGNHYGWHYLLTSAIGLYTSANLYQDLNSPMWFFTMILFYYLVFPWLFLKTKGTWWKALLLAVTSWLLITIAKPTMPGVYDLLLLHFLAFPAGVLAAWAKHEFYSHNWTGLRQRLSYKWWSWLYASVMVALVYVICSTAIYSHVGENPYLEQVTSLVTAGAIITLFILKPFRVQLFYVFGLVSFEIFLFKWPWMYQYDLLFNSLPAWLAVISYICLFMIAGWLLHKLTAFITKLMNI